MNYRDQASYLGAASLMREVISGVELSRLINVAANNPDEANRLMSMSIIFQAAGNLEMGLELQARALEKRQLYHQPTADGQPEIRLLVIVRPGDMMYNTPVDFLLEGFDVAIDMLFVSLHMPFPEVLPDHDVLFVAIGQTDENQPLLEQLDALVKLSPHAVLNQPGRIARLSRNEVSSRLRSAPGVEIPLTIRVDRQSLQRIQHGEQSIGELLENGDFPVIVRPVGSHGGEKLARIDKPESMANYLGSLPDKEFYVARFVDYRGPDGLYRKCRIALIAGQPFACHLALSENWMIHYKTAGMAESAEKRTVEASFMASFDHDFARRHQPAFRAIGERMGLDYLVIDCAEAPSGDLLVFEADNLGFVHALDPVDVFPYKPAQMRKVFAAFHGMLLKAMQRKHNLR